MVRYGAKKVDSFHLFYLKKKRFDSPPFVFNEIRFYPALAV